MLDTNGGGLPARLRYLSGSFHVVSPGDHVVCAVSNAHIPLGNLRYWSHELQEAYGSAELAVQRYNEAHAAGRL